jgi:hypothetical protein
MALANFSQAYGLKGKAGCCDDNDDASVGTGGTGREEADEFDFIGTGNMSVEIGCKLFDCDDFDGRMVTGASSGGGFSSLCFSFQCLFRLFLHLYKLPHNEQAYFTRIEEYV